jgi:type VI secretion system secreted protein VgrG
MSTVTQEARPLTLETPLGKDVLLPANFTAFESISGLFHFHLDLLRERPAGAPAPIALDALLGKPVTVRLQLAKGTRLFHGIVSVFGEAGSDGRFDSYYAEVVPWLWLLTLSADCRIFQDMTVPDIITKVFKDRGFLDFRPALKRTYTKWDYCVQYRETDFNFVSRMMEQEGIYYFFEHAQGKHTLVLADSPEAHVPCPGQPQARFEPEAGFGGREDVISGWQTERAMRPGKYTLRDYHFETPSKTLEVNRSTAFPAGNNGKLAIYDYPGEYAQRFNKPSQRLGDVEPEGATVDRLRMEEQEYPHLVVRGSSTCRAFSAGFRFDLLSPPPGAEAGPYLLTSVQHTVSQAGAFVSGGAGDFSYQNTFVCSLLKVPFRPPRVTTKPVIQGPQTAVVVGTKGQEIMTDKFGRIKVQFFWDREGKKDENSSCWVRVAQPVAGKRWGASFWPRIGQEVVVTFLEGDPEMPLITGSVYNAEQMPPYLGDGLDGKHKNDNKVSGFKTNSTLGGQGFNELRFDDTKDKEQVFLRSQRDMDVRALNDTRETVGANRHLTVGGVDKNGNKVGDQYELVGKDKHLHVKGKHVEQIEGDMQLLVGGGDGGNQEIVVKKDKKELIEGDSHLHVKKARNEKVDGTQSLTVGGNQQEKVSQNHALDAGMAIHLKAGMTLVLEAGTELTLKVGGNFIDINPGGVFIQGTMVMINSGGAAGSGAGSSPTAPQDAKEASPTKPTDADDSKSGLKSAP